jgi:hypothetical protein
VTATFTVEVVEYREGCTTVTLAMGTVGGADRMGTKGELVFSGCLPMPLTPGEVVRLEFYPATSHVPVPGKETT